MIQQYLGLPVAEQAQTAEMHTPPCDLQSIPCFIHLFTILHYCPNHFCFYRPTAVRKTCDVTWDMTQEQASSCKVWNIQTVWSNEISAVLWVSLVALSGFGASWHLPVHVSTSSCQAFCSSDTILADPLCLWLRMKFCAVHWRISSWLLSESSSSHRRGFMLHLGHIGSTTITNLKKFKLRFTSTSKQLVIRLGKCGFSERSDISRIGA